MLKNERQLRSVRNIVQITLERSFQSISRSDVYGQPFELSTPNVKTLIELQIQESLENYEPRIDNIKVFANSRPDRNEFEVTITYDIVGQEFPPQNYTFILKSTR